MLKILLFVFMLVVGTGAPEKTYGLGLLPACMSKDACVVSLDCKNGYYCCPSGEYAKKCPTGWTYTLLADSCTRRQTTGVDDIGYTQTTYDTCEPTMGDACYAVYNTIQTGKRCHECTAK